MDRWYNDEDLNKGSFHSLKVGETVNMTVKEVTKNTAGNPLFHLKRKDGTSLGYSIYVTDTNDRVLNVNTFALLGLLKKEKIDAGDRIEIRHLAGKGNYELNILKKVATEEDEQQ